MEKLLNGREYIEWSNIWIEDAANENRNRILLIGDSVTRQFRSTLSSLTQEKGYSVDLLAMSHSIHDRMAYDKIQFFFEIAQKNSYNYEYILFQVGYHHGFSYSCNTNKEVRAQYKCNMIRIMNDIQKYCENLYIISATPEQNGNGEGGNNHIPEIVERNKINQEIALELQIKYINLYDDLVYKKIRFTDVFHMQRGMDYYVASIICNMVLNTDYANICFEKLNYFSELISVIDEDIKIYIFGHSKRGKALEDFLKIYLNRDVEKFIVSSQYYIEDYNEIVIEQFTQDNSMVFVTPNDLEVWKMFPQNANKYFCLADVLYKEMYVFNNLKRVEQL